MPVKPRIMCPWILEREIQLDNGPIFMKALAWVAVVIPLFKLFLVVIEIILTFLLGQVSRHILPHDCTFALFWSSLHKFLMNIWSLHTSRHQDHAHSTTCLIHPLNR